MNTQTITWTTLPNGIVSLPDQSALALSVFVAPRLKSSDKNATLADFVDSLDWPETLFPAADRRPAIFHVYFSSGMTYSAMRIGDPPDSRLWRALFSASTPIEPFEMKDFKNMPIQSLPVRNVLDFLKKEYINLATTQGENYPNADSLVLDSNSPFRPLAMGFRGVSEEKIVTDITNELMRNNYNPSGSVADSAEISKSFVKAKMFLAPFSAKRVDIKKPEIDFHRMISILGDYPHLLRRLGLVHDLVIPIPTRTATKNTVQVMATWMPNRSDVETVNLPSTSQRLETRCYVSSDGFYALPRESSPEIADRMLPLENTRRWEVVHIDTEGSAIKMLNFATGLAVARTSKKTDDTPDATSVPSLRAGGISVARIDKAKDTHETFVRQDEINEKLETGEDIRLDAEDITCGYAIDIWDSATKGWHSLCERSGTYEFTKSTPPLVEEAEDEGWVSESVTSAADDSSNVLKQGESLFHWNGWSLSVPRPGKTLDEDGNPAYTGGEVDPNYGLDINFKPIRGSLPRLRYGVGYRVRARAVDLAGNRLDIDDRSLEDDEHATRMLVYGRMEPVPPPVTVMRGRVTEGESVDHVVIRSNYDKPFEQVSERHIVPPKVSQSLAEEHQLFDDAETGLVDTNAYSVIVPKEAGIITGAPDPDNQGHPYVDEDNLVLPWLPDVFARRAVLRGIPGIKEPVVVSFGYDEGGRWPNALPFRLVLGEADKAEVIFNEDSRELKVLLPKAEIGRLKLSSAMNKDDAIQMGLVNWILEDGKDATSSLALAVEGRHWMLTPWKGFTLVHAVRQPLATPEFDQFNVTRGIGETYATLYDRMMKVSNKSTVKIDMVAEWQETIDPLGEAGPRVLTVNARPFEQTVPLASTPEEEGRFYLEGRHEFGDTKYRQIRYSAIATTRFAEYFRKRDKNVRLGGSTPFTLSSEGLVEGSETVKLADNSATYKRWDPETKSGDYVMDYEGGTIRRTGPDENPGAIPENENLEITYIELPITRVTESPRTLDVLSTARPAAPKVLYIVPTFRWETQGGDGAPTIVSERRGGGLRIYLERPWYTSGDGEMLAAIIWPGPDNISVSKDAALERIRPFVTQWGMDPVFASVSINDMPTLAAFKLSKRQHQATGLLLEEVNDQNMKVNVAGHVVGYDADRKLWYCDMEINTGGTYFPFIRLALARYQPNSLSRAIEGSNDVIDTTRDNVHLSRVVLADFAQIAPDRFASVTREGAGSAVRHISVTGQSYGMAGGAEGPATIEVSLEKLRTGIDAKGSYDELAWEPVDGKPVTLAPSTNMSIDGSTTWTGDITLPDTTKTYRLLIKEFEVFTIPGMVPIYQRRLVYADALELAP